MSTIPFEFLRLPTGCHVCVSHKANHDGYVRVRVNREGGRQHIMLHRLILELRGHAIPDGFEVDHTCSHRPCCAPDHLVVVPRGHHLAKTNRGRYAGRKGAARLHWERDPSTTGTALAAEFGVTFGAACLWIRQWKADKATTLESEQ